MKLIKPPYDIFIDSRRLVDVFDVDYTDKLLTIKFFPTDTELAQDIANNHLNINSVTIYGSLHAKAEKAEEYEKAYVRFLSNKPSRTSIRLGRQEVLHQVLTLDIFNVIYKQEEKIEKSDGPLVS